jgi:hypothetical protein
LKEVFANIVYVIYCVVEKKAKPEIYIYAMLEFERCWENVVLFVEEEFFY